MNQLCPFCWAELRPAARAVTMGTQTRTLPLLECAHCAAAGTSNLIHSHHAYRNAVLRVEHVARLLKDGTQRERDIAADISDALGTGLML